MKKNMNFTHLEIIFENCEYWEVPVEYICISTKDKYLHKVSINMAKLLKDNKLSKWCYETLEKRIGRLTNNANDITHVHFLQINNNLEYFEFPRKNIPIKSYLESNLYLCYQDNLLQTTTYKNGILYYEWIVDSNILIDYNLNTITIPSKYKEIISKLDTEVWGVN
ncbi:MAG: hypothetical protein ACRC42_01620 [Mycoplasma sp.]